MRHKRIIIDLHFDGATDPEANNVCDAIAANCCSEDQLMRCVLETLEANKIMADVTWEVRRETWHSEKKIGKYRITDEDVDQHPDR